MPLLFPYLPWSDETGWHDLGFLMLSLKSAFALFSFTFIKRFFSFSLLSAIRVVSSAYLRLLIFLLAIFIPAWASFSLAFHMMYSTYKINKQGDDVQPWRIPFPILKESIPCPGECNCVVDWAFFGIAFLWDWNENWPFPVLWPLLQSAEYITLCRVHHAKYQAGWSTSWDCWEKYQ